MPFRVRKMKFPILPLRAVMVPSIDLSCIVFGGLIVFDIDYLVAGGVLHVPAVGFGSCAVLGVVLLKGEFLPALGLEVQNKEIRISPRVSPMYL